MIKQREQEIAALRETQKMVDYEEFAALFEKGGECKGPPYIFHASGSYIAQIAAQMSQLRGSKDNLSPTVAGHLFSTG